MIAPPLEWDPVATYDALGRKAPHRLGFLQYARAMPSIAAHFTARVPAKMVTFPGYNVAEFRCACGELVRAEHNRLQTCACDRMFVFIGGRVRVGYLGERHDAR